MNRERIQILRDHLASLPDGRFQMMHWNTAPTLGELKHDCGTAACIGGWAEALFADEDDEQIAEKLLGLTQEQGGDLFCPPGYQIPGRYTREDAIATLDHLLETGEVVWQS